MVKCRFIVIMLTKHYIILLLSLVLGCASCQWHEAEAVVAMADSIDQTQHVIYDDTAALGLVIRQLDNPMGRVFKHSTLGKAYYYMGRNLEDNHQQIAKAAECYIEADRLQIDDPIYRGRVNSCMGYICIQYNNDSLALIFDERASASFKEGTDDWYYAQSLLNISENYISLHQFLDADSILQIAKSYQLDNAYQARWYEMKGLYFYKQQQYDSALVYFMDVCNWRKEQEEFMYNYLKIMQIYLEIGNLSQATSYAQFIINNSDDAHYLVNAYYCLMKDAEEQNNTELLSIYAHTRADVQKSLRSIASEYANAVSSISEYVYNPYPFRWVWNTISIIITLCILLILCVLIYKKHTSKTLQHALKKNR